MKKISEARLECLNRLLERAVKFRCKDYCVSCDFNCKTNGVHVSIWGRESYDSVIIFNFCYDDMKIKKFEKLTDKIISVLDETEKNGGVESVIEKLPVNKYGFVNIDEFVRR